MPFADLPTGIDVYYEVEGTGEPLLLIMGTGADHSTWAGQVEAYRHNYTVITYDNRGTGQSTHPTDASDYSMRILADDAAALLDCLGVERAHVSGLSLGSATAQEFAVNHPDKVATLQLHCTWGRSDEWFIRMIDTNETYILHDDFAGYIRAALLWVASPTFINDQPADVEAFERGFILENPHPPSARRGCSATSTPTRPTTHSIGSDPSRFPPSSPPERWTGRCRPATAWRCSEP